MNDDVTDTSASLSAHRKSSEGAHSGLWGGGGGGGGDTVIQYRIILYWEM